MLNSFGDGVTLFLGIVIEAFPFLLLGSIVSTLIQLFVKTETLLKYLPHNRLGACASISLIGMLFPVCECGNIPVARKLIEKKLPAGASLSFLLGAPILNPIVIITTIVAFPDTPEIWWGRVLLAFFIATFVGYLWSFAPEKEIINHRFIQKGGNHHHHNPQSKWQTSFDHTISEFISMAGVMIIGAFIAAAMQTLFPRELITAVAQTPLISILAMMALGFVISICSTTDAFFALAYAHQFSTASLVAFLVFGPMIDIKALLLMRTTYTSKAVIYLTLLVGLLVVVGTYALDIFIW